MHHCYRTLRCSFHSLLQLRYRTGLAIVLVDSNHAGNRVVLVILPNLKPVEITVLSGWDDLIPLFTGEAHLVGKLIDNLVTGLTVHGLVSSSATTSSNSSQRGTAANQVVAELLCLLELLVL